MGGHEGSRDGGWFASSGWALLPLRLFLGFTLLYAGIIKFSDPTFLDPGAPGGIEAQMRLAVKASPIGGLVSLLLSQSTALGVLIALAEIAVGVSLLLGIWVRLGALLGALLSLSLLLAVSWGTTPYFFGVDIVFLFAFTPFVLAGDGGVWSVGTAIADRFRLRLPREPIRTSG